MSLFPGVWRGASRLALGLWVALAATVHASPLACAKPVLALEVAAGQRQASGDFEVANGGKTSVSIVSLKPSCTCTVATCDRTTLAPGESCRIHATFSAGDRSGNEQKSITVATDGDQGQALALTLQVHITTYIEMTPRLALWARGGPPTDQVFECTPGTASAIHLKTVRCTDPHLVVGRIEEVEPGRVYRAHVAPRDTSVAFAAQLVFQVDVAGAGEQTMVGTVLVK